MNEQYTIHERFFHPPPCDAQAVPSGDQEVKREEVKVKEEVKEEEEEFDAGLNDLFDSAVVKEKKSKRHTHSAINQDNGAVFIDAFLL